MNHIGKIAFVSVTLLDMTGASSCSSSDISTYQTTIGADLAGRLSSCGTVYGLSACFSMQGLSGTCYTCLSMVLEPICENDCARYTSTEMACRSCLAGEESSAVSTCGLVEITTSTTSETTTTTTETTTTTTTEEPTTTTTEESTTTTTEEATTPMEDTTTTSGLTGCASYSDSDTCLGYSNCSWLDAVGCYDHTQGCPSYQDQDTCLTDETCSWNDTVGCYPTDLTTTTSSVGGLLAASTAAVVMASWAVLL
jgi:hypothetical protein